MTRAKNMKCGKIKLLPYKAVIVLFFLQALNKCTKVLRDIFYHKNQRFIIFHLMYIMTNLRNVSPPISSVPAEKSQK